MWDLFVNTGKLSPSDFVRVTSSAAARIFNVYVSPANAWAGLLWVNIWGISMFVRGFPFLLLDDNCLSRVYSSVPNIKRRSLFAWALTPRSYPQKGVIAPGSDADVILLDPKKR